MTAIDRLDLLRRTAAEIGQGETARRLGCSGSAISQILSGSYKASPDAILQKVEETFGATMTDCPVLGKISLGRCAQERKKPFAATNPVRVRLYRACKECDQNPQGRKP